MLEVGKRFPDFALPNQDGTTISLKDFAGKWLVVHYLSKGRHLRLYAPSQIIHREPGRVRRGRSVCRGSKPGRCCVA
jgi:hypothetical protein